MELDDDTNSGIDPDYYKYRYNTSRMPMDGGRTNDRHFLTPHLSWRGIRCAISLSRSTHKFSYNARQIFWHIPFGDGRSLIITCFHFQTLNTQQQLQQPQQHLHFETPPFVANNGFSSYIGILFSSLIVRVPWVSSNAFLDVVPKTRIL